MTRVAASSSRPDPDGSRLPAGEVHGWEPGRNETVCGLSLSRSALSRFAGVSWPDVQPASGGAADFVDTVCARCRAALTPRAERSGRGWRRTAPRP